MCSHQSNHYSGNANATRRVFAGNGEETLRRLMYESWEMIASTPENAEEIISDLCREVDAWVQHRNNGDRVTMDLLTRIEQGEFFFTTNKESKKLVDKIVDRVGERLTSHYVGYDVGSLDQSSMTGNPTQLQARSSGNVVPSKSIDLKLLEEQARALEATIGVRKAESIVELLGRKTLSLEEMNRIQNIPEKCDAERILEVLVYIDDRKERRELMQEAFIPISADAGIENTEEQEAISTSPMALYQCILAWQKRCNDDHDTVLIEGISQEKIQKVLEELRTDVFDSLQSQ